MGKNVFIYPEMATFFLIFTPGFAPVRPQNKGNLGDIWRSDTPNLSFDLGSKYNVYNVIYREMGTFLPILSPGFCPFDPFLDPLL